MSQSLAKSEPVDRRELNVRDGVEQIESASARLVYVYLAAVGEATVDELCDSLALTRLTLFPLLEKLQSNELVTEYQGLYTTAN